MVRERKTRIKDIKKLHELIDSASLPKQKTFTPSENERLENLRKRLSEDSIEKQRAVPPQGVGASFSSLTPRVIVHKKEEPQKKEEKIIQIDLRPRAVKKEKEPEPTIVNFIHVKDDIFSKEPLFEIEKVAVSAQEFIEVKPSETAEEYKTENEFIPVVSVRKGPTQYPAEFEFEKKEKRSLEPPDKASAKKKETFTEKVQRVKENQTHIPSFSQEPEEEIPSFEPVECTETATEKKEFKPLVGTITKEKDSKEKKMEEKQAKRLSKERQKKLKVEDLQTEEKLREEHKRKELEIKQAIAQAEEKEREEERLLREREEKTRLENLNVLDKQRQERKRKKLEAKKAKLELKEKKKETKRLAKEHDRKLKLEWVEFQHAQRQNLKTKALEEKKAALIAKDKEQEERRLLKDREEKLRLEQAAIVQREKEERNQKKIEEKKAKQEKKEKQRMEKLLAKEHEMKLKFEQLHTEQKRREEEQKELQRKQAASQAEEKQRQRQPLMHQREEKTRMEHTEKQKKEEEQKISKIKKEKKMPAVAAIAEENKILKHQPASSQMLQGKQSRSPKSFAVEKEEPDVQTWESYEEKAIERKDRHISIFTKESRPVDTQKSTLKLQKKQQKEKERQERLELKKKRKEEKIQKKQEQKQRSILISEKREDKEGLKQKKIEEKLAKREAKEKERLAKQRLKEEQTRKERAFTLKDRQIKEKEKEEEKQKEIKDKKDRLQISRLGIGKAKDTEVTNERKQAEQQKSTMELVRIAAEEKELRKTRAFERKMEKERKKKEKEEQKFKIKEEEKAKRNMDVHFKEQFIKEKLTKQPDRDDPFIAFDSIDKETAMLLSTVGYTSVEKLRQASVKDLVKVGLKKKNAQRIIAECEEFVEWEAFDATDHF